MHHGLFAFKEEFEKVKLVLIEVGFVGCDLSDAHG
jgi:hypothetical protein